MYIDGIFNNMARKNRLESGAASLRCRTSVVHYRCHIHVGELATRKGNIGELYISMNNAFFAH